VVRRFSVASRECGAESPVYAAEPSATAVRDDAAARPQWGGGGGRRAALAVPGAAFRARQAGRAGAWTRVATRRAGCRPASRKMVCKGHPCIYTADEDSMAQFASSEAVPCGRRVPRKLTDVHGREG
jgi:hypothetical protein